VPIILKPGDTLNDYVVVEKIDDDGYVKRYSATTRLAPTEVQVRQYFSPGGDCRGYKKYVQSRRDVLTALSDQPDAGLHVLKVLEMFQGIEVRGVAHNEVILVTEPAPPLLHDLLEDRSLDGPTRLKLAREIARGTAALHRAGIAWGLIDPWHIGVSADSRPLFVEPFCARVIDNYQSWDLPFVGQYFGAPELVEGDHSSRQSDVYALGFTLLRLLTGREKSEILPLGEDLEFAADLPVFDRLRTERLLRAALSHDPASRPAAEDLAAALDGSGAVNDVPLLPDTPSWLSSPLQALAFWVAYQNVAYRHHLLPEGAIVAEFTRLLDAELGGLRVVVREPMYRELASAAGTSWADACRCDIAVRSKTAGRQQGPVLAAIEVKRAAASDDVINDDLFALHQLKVADPSIRVFLVLVSQADWPRRWVTHDGLANREVETLSVSEEGQPDHEVRIRVRRVTKAALSFKWMTKATYCCLLEVL